jgi:hypothetical protein
MPECYHSGVMLLILKIPLADCPEYRLLYAYNIDITIMHYAITFEKAESHMPKFRLVKVSPIGKRTDIITSFESESLIEAGENLAKKNPGVQFAVTDELGFFIWPSKLKSASPRQ